MAVGDGVMGTHVPHVSPGNPGAPEVDDAATYPGAQVPEYVMPQDAYPAGQFPHPVPIAYCPGAQTAVGVGVREAANVRERVAAGVRVCEATATSSRRP